MAWSASILVKLSMLGKIPWHWSMIIYASKALERFLSWFWPIPTSSFPEQLLDMVWQLEQPRSHSSRQFASDNLLWRLKQFVRKDKGCPVPVGLIAWRCLWIHLICWCRCSHSETCSHMWAQEQAKILAAKNFLRGRKAQNNVPLETILLHCLFLNLKVWLLHKEKHFAFRFCFCFSKMETHFWKIAWFGGYHGTHRFYFLSVEDILLPRLLHQ